MSHTEPAASTSIKETLISIIIAFALAFVFRGFVIEGFAIPTGSMAPTLLGQHMLFRSPESGYEWPVGPRDDQDGGPTPLQGTGTNPISVRDPMSGEVLSKTGVPIRGGDSIFVLKYLDGVYEPRRFDVVVFKNPRDPTMNYIKRLIGLPNEQVALVDGDVFTRTINPGDEANPNPWMLDGWHVARKPERAQRAMWQPVFHSDYTPITGSRDGRTFFKNPWRTAGDGTWSTTDRGAFVATGNATLEWDTTLVTIDDAYPYNAPIQSRLEVALPVGDMRIAFGIKPTTPDFIISPTVLARGHEFRATITTNAVSVAMRPQAVPGSGTNTAPWKELATAPLASTITPAAFTNIEFWHVDQSLQVWVEGSLVVTGNYDWSVADRTQNTFGKTPKQIAESPYENLLLMPEETRPVGARIRVEGGATLLRVDLDRDIHYHAAIFKGDENRTPHQFYLTPATATHPTRTLTLNSNEFFMCGDNSPASLDGRLWDSPNPWVSAIDPKMGIVHRQLIIGRAFYVYFPAASRKLRLGNTQLPIRPDFGRMRWIW